MARKKRVALKATSKDAAEYDAVSKPDYGEQDQPQPVAPNRTDAEGVDSFTQPGALEGIDQTRATPHTTPEVTDPNWRYRQRMEAEARGEEIPAKERGPQVLIGNYDVRRGAQVYRIPPGTVVEDAELTDEEWDHIVHNGLVREATYTEVIQAQQRQQTDETQAKLLELRKEKVGVKPKKSGGDKPPKGAKLVVDLEESGAETMAGRAAKLAKQYVTEMQRVGAGK